MEITENTFIDILGLPDWDDRVLEILEVLELDRPEVKEGEVYAYLSSSKYDIALMFDYDSITLEQKAMEDAGNLYLNQITFNENTTLILPYNIHMGDNYNTIVNKIGRKTDLPEEYINDSCGWEFDMPYWLSCTFEDKAMKSLKKLFIRIQEPYKFE